MSTQSTARRARSYVPSVRRLVGRTMAVGVLAAGALWLPDPARADEVDDLVRKEMAERRIPGLTLAVVRHGVVVKAQGYGFANLEHRVPARRETVYQSGSVGKQFTATAVMQLVEEGQVRLDEPIGRYFPEAPATWNKVTVRHLLNHTGGVARDYFSNLREDRTEDQLLRTIFAMDMVGEPGFARAYSNAGYVVLGALVARISRKPYARFLEERIFAPLGMHTARVVSEVEVIADRAAGYELVDGEVRNQRWVAPVYNRTGDGALYFTVDDLIKWDAALYTEAVLRKSSLEQMWSPVKTASGTISEYGFGWALDGIKGHRRVHHAGSWQGLSASIERYPDDRLSVIVLMNMGHPAGRAGEVASRVARIYLAAARR